MTKEDDWNYWRETHSFQLFQGMQLLHGFLPPRNLELLEYEEASDLQHYLKTMANFSDDFLCVLSSIRADKNIGAEFRALTNEQAAIAYISKEDFLAHCRKCRLPTQKKLISETRGRPREINSDELWAIAENCIKEREGYADFLKAIEKQFGNKKVKTARNRLSNQAFQEMAKLPENKK